MNAPIHAFLAFALASAPLPAQQPVLADPGPTRSPSAGAAAGGGQRHGAACGSGSTTTAFHSNHAYAGNMFDIAPSVDMTIECVDVNWSVVESIDVAVWWCPGTVVGNDVNQLGTWVQFATGTGMGAGTDVPANINLTAIGANPVFRAGSTFGIYLQVVNYGPAAGSLRYTSVAGPTTYAGTHCDLTAYYGKADGLTSSTFSYRAWNGTLYTEVAGPSLTRAGSCPGGTTLTASDCTAGGHVAFLHGAAGSYTKPNNPCQGIVLGIGSPTLGTILNANGSGTASLTFNAPAGACGLTVQAVDVASCTPTNTVTL